MADRLTPDLKELSTGVYPKPPQETSVIIKAKVRLSLAFEPWMVFLKLWLSGLAGGVISLRYCPQFTDSHVMDEAVMSPAMAGYDHTGCMMACGATFLAISIGVAMLVLNAQELQLVRRTQFLQIPAAALLSLSMFVCSGAEVMLGAGLLWLIGGILAGLATLNVGWLLRARLEPLLTAR